MRCHHQLRQGQQLGYVVLGFLGEREVPVVGRQAELLVAFDGAADGALAGVVGRQCQQPVAVEHFVQAVQIVQSGVGGGGNVAAAVVPVGLAQVVVTAGGRDELPDADGVATGIGEGVVGAFHDRQQRQFEGHVALFQALHHVVDIETAAGAGAFQERRLAYVPEALALDTRVDADFVLQLEAIAHALPDVLGFALGFGFFQPLGLLAHVQGAVGILARVVALLSHARTAGKGGSAHHDERARGPCQCIQVEGFDRRRQHWLWGFSGKKVRRF
ncbi:hypothetical protein D9M71_266440 [compost metagenome]